MKFKIISAFVLSSLMVLCATSCRKVRGDGNIIEKTYDIADFNMLESPINAKISYQYGTTASLKIQGDSNIVSQIDYFVVNKRLRFSYKRNNMVIDRPVTIVISSPTLAEVKLTGNGSMVIPTLEVPEFDIETSGATNVVVGNLTTQDFEVEISGSGNVTIESGVINAADISIKGSGYVDKLNALTQYTAVDIIGSGYLKTQTIENLKVNITGSGNVFYKGNPSIDVSITGSGRMEQLD